MTDTQRVTTVSNRPNKHYTRPYSWHTLHNILSSMLNLNKNLCTRWPTSSLTERPNSDIQLSIIVLTGLYQNGPKPKRPRPKQPIIFGHVQNGPHQCPKQPNLSTKRPRVPRLKRRRPKRPTVFASLFFAVACTLYKLCKVRIRDIQMIWAICHRQGC